MPTIKSIETRLGLTLDVSNPELLTTADTYYPLNSTLTTDESNKFSGMTFTGANNTVVAFVGASQGSSDTVAKITYALFINGLPTIVTPLDMTVTGKAVSFAATKYITLNNGDVINGVRIKSDTANTTYTISTLGTTLKGF